MTPMPTPTIDLVLRELHVTTQTPEIQVPDNPDMFLLNPFHTSTATRTDWRPLRSLQLYKKTFIIMTDTSNLKSQKIILALEYQRVFTPLAHVIVPTLQEQAVT
jgi:hypothetical protein